MTRLVGCAPASASANCRAASQTSRAQLQRTGVAVAGDEQGAPRAARSHAQRDHGLRTHARALRQRARKRGVGQRPRARHRRVRAAIARDEAAEPVRSSAIHAAASSVARTRRSVGESDSRQRMALRGAPRTTRQAPRVVDLAVAARRREVGIAVARFLGQRVRRASPRNRPAVPPATARACRSRTSCRRRPRRRGAARRAAGTACRRVRAPSRASVRIRAAASVRRRRGRRSGRAGSVADLPAAPAEPLQQKHVVLVDVRADRAAVRRRS